LRAVGVAKKPRRLPLIPRRQRSVGRLLNARAERPVAERPVGRQAGALDDTGRRDHGKREKECCKK